MDLNPTASTDPKGLAKKKTCVNAYIAGGAVCGGAVGYYGGGALGGVGGAAAAVRRVLERWFVLSGALLAEARYGAVRALSLGGSGNLARQCPR